MTRWLPVIVAVLVVWAAVVFAWWYFAAVHREQNERDDRLDRREASLELWSAELAEFDVERVERARRATDLLDRAFGTAPPQPDDCEVVS